MILFSGVPSQFWKPKTLATCQHKYHVLRLSGFGVHSWICKQVSDLDKNICRSSNFIKILQQRFFRFDKLFKMISKKHCTSYIFPRFQSFVWGGEGFQKYFGFAPYRLPYLSSEDYAKCPISIFCSNYVADYILVGHLLSLWKKRWLHGIVLWQRTRKS